MQTQSRLIMNPDGGSSGFGSPAADESFEAVLRELTHGHELTAQLQAEALRALRGQGQAEATAAFILQEVSRAFSVCISIMGGSVPAATTTATAPPQATTVVAAATGGRSRDDGVPRRTTVTSSPYSDGYQWRKYGQKTIMRTSFHRCYYRCSYHRERNCPATKQVQQRQDADGDQPMYDVIYVHEHTCDISAPPEPEAAAPSSTPDTLDFSAGLPREQPGGVGIGVAVLDRCAKEELEFVSSLACVLHGHQQQCHSGSGAGTPEESPSQRRTGGDGASTSGAVPLDAFDDVGLDVMDYGVTDDTLFFAPSSSYLLPGGDTMIP